MPESNANTAESAFSPAYRRMRRWAIIGFIFGFLMATALGLVIALPSIVASAANSIIRNLLPGGVIECTVSQIGLFQANLAIDARQAPTQPDQPGQRIVKLPHCRITYRPFAIIRGRIETIEIIGATMTAQYENGVFTLPIMELLPQASTPEDGDRQSPGSAEASPDGFDLSGLPDIGSISLQSCAVMLRWEKRFYYTPLSLEITQGDNGWENLQVRASMRLDGQLLMLRELTYDAKTGRISGQARLSELRLDALPPPMETFVDEHRLRGRIEINADFKANLRQPALTSINTTFTVKDFHALFGKETIASPAINATLDYHDNSGAFAIGPIDTTSLGRLNRLEWAFNLTSHLAGNGLLTMTFQNTAASPLALHTTHQRLPDENKTVFTLAATADAPPNRLRTAWGEAAAGALAATFTHTPEAITAELNATQVAFDSPQAALAQADFALNAEMRAGILTAQGRSMLPQTTIKAAQATLADTTITAAMTAAEGKVTAEVTAASAAMTSPSPDLKAQKLSLTAKGQGNKENMTAELQIQIGSLTAPDNIAIVNNLNLDIQAQGTVQQFAGDIVASIASIAAERYDVAFESIFWRQHIDSEAPGLGTLTIASLFHKDDNLLACTINTSVIPAADRQSVDFNLNTAVVFQDFPTARLQLSSKNRVGRNIILSQNTFHLPETELADFDVLRFLPDLKKLTLSGAISLDGAYALGGGRPPQGSAKVTLHQAGVALPEQKILVENLNLCLELPVLPELRTLPGQPLDCQKLQIGNLVVHELQARARLESTDIMTLERVQAKWASGMVRLGATQINLKQPEPDLIIFCDRIDLAEAFHQLGNDQVSGHGALSGTLPLTIKKGNIRFGDGFLSTIPGVAGDIKLSAASALTAGVPVGTPAYNQLKFSGDALRHFLYDWLKISLNNKEDDLQLRLQVCGKPATPLPYSYVKGEFVAIEGKTDFSQIQLDVNLNLPVNNLLSAFSELKHIIRKGP
ncbi:MAG TPA: YdbH domain-containing protein [Lentisphaeria bacterium]|nr:YdbH domain-containing protein [Lentisphaeria bacterium]